MASYNPVVKNGASGAIFYVSLAPRTANGSWQANPTLAAGDVQISKDGGALANLTTLPVVTPASSKLVKVTLSQTECNADNLIVIFSDAAGAEWCDLTINLQTVAENFDSLGTDIAAVQADTDNIQTRLPAALVSGRIDASVGAMATDVLTNTALAASAVTEIQTGLATPTNITAGTITTVTNLTNAPTAGDFTATMKTSITTAATAATPTVTLAASALAAIWDRLTSALTTVGSIGKLLVDNVNATISSRATQTSVDVVDDFVDPEIANIQSRLPAALVSGRMDSSVGAMATGVVTATAIATDAIGSAQLAASAVTEINTGIATSAAVAALPTAAQNATELLDQAAGVETGLTVRGALRLALAALAGKVSGAGTSTEIFRNSVADSKARITSTVDASGNRTAITTDVT
jgi:hypothetical protein